MRLSVLVVFAIVGLLGCGGRYEEPGTQKQPTGDPSSMSDSSGNTSASTSSGSGASGSLPTHPLGQCVPGFEHASDPGRACA
ncbi:MAG TPA: hypothetical protein VHV51_03720 [Polyangiaceae bacterium]|nr:hypothetical protein [Polyangiaceae bacterium]